MTDYTDLIARLRANPTSRSTMFEAADALEKQAKRIAELGDANVSLANLNEGLMKMLMNRDARIAELEAALKFYSCSCDIADNRSQRCGGAHDEQFCGYAARAALEKKDA